MEKLKMNGRNKSKKEKSKRRNVCRTMKMVKERRQENYHDSVTDIEKYGQAECMNREWNILVQG